MSHRTVLISNVGGQQFITGRGHHPARDQAIHNALATHFEFTDRGIKHAVRVVDDHNEQQFAISSGTCQCHRTR